MTTPESRRSFGVLPALAALAALAALTWSAAFPERAWAQATTPVTCAPIADSSPRRIQCPLAVADPAAVTAANVLVANTGAAVPSQLEERPPLGDTASWLFLIDRSNPRRAGAVRFSGDLVKAVTANAQPNERFAIATLAEDYRLVQPFTSDAAQIATAADGLTAGGAATELYRNALTGIRALAEQPGSRKALVLISDGKAEDTAFTVDQVADAAREAGVLIYGVGVPERATDTPDLQPLRILSERTGGPYVTIDVGNRTPPPAYVSRFKAPLVGGGRFVTFEAPDPATNYVIDLTVTGANAPVRLAASQAAAGAAQTVPVTPTAQTGTGSGDGATSVTQGLFAQFDDLQTLFWQYWEDDTYFWVIIGAGVLLLLVLFWLLFGRRRRNDEFDAGTGTGIAGPGVGVGADGLAAGGVAASAASRFVSRPHGAGETAAPPPEIVTAKLAPAPAPGGDQPTVRMAPGAEATSYATFEIEENGRIRDYEVRAATLKIGRHEDNDLTLSHETVHRAHAVLHRTPSGDLILTDLNTTNGIVVNGKLVEKASLTVGDVVELGEATITVRDIA